MYENRKRMQKMIKSLQFEPLRRSFMRKSLKRKKEVEEGKNKRSKRN